MKIIIYITMAIGIMLSMTGCGAAKSPIPMVQYQGVSENGIGFKGSINEDEDKASIVQNLAIQIREAAKVMKSRGYNYFYILPQFGVPSMIVDMKSLVSYCYPESNGFNAENIDSGSSSLEEKCKVKYKENGATSYFKGVKEPIFNQPTWSVKEVLKDEFIENFIKAALQDGEYENPVITFKKG
jgi:hypothetical protein